MGQKNSKGTVSLQNASGRIRLRWRYQSKRYSLSLYSFSKQNLLQARITALEIEQDMLNNLFDISLKKYKGELLVIPLIEKSIVAYFEEWVTNYKQMDCDKHTNYNSTRSMLKKWGDIQEENIQKKLSLQTNAPVTFNRRLTILKNFAKWLVKKRIWRANPLEDVNPKKVKKVKLPKRAPFTLEEIHLILVIKNTDTTENKIFTIRGQQIMLDRDLASLYLTDTGTLKQSVKRKIDKFPSDFMFELKNEDIESLVSQIVTSSLGNHGGTRKQPMLFTEQGVAMLSALLKSNTAIKVSVEIIKAFVAMGKSIAASGNLVHRIEGVEKKLLENDEKIKKVFTALEQKDTLLLRHQQYKMLYRITKHWWPFELFKIAARF